MLRGTRDPPRRHLLGLCRDRDGGGSTGRNGNTGGFGMWRLKDPERPINNNLVPLYILGVYLIGAVLVVGSAVGLCRLVMMVFS